MVGRISALGSATLFGVIKADNGLSVRFDRSEVMAYDATGLALDQLVSFDIDNGPSPKATNVCVRKDLQAPVREEGRPDPMRLRFMGFDQRGAARIYKFDQVAVGVDAIHMVVEIPMALFTEYHVGIQDGPALCLHALNGDSKRESARELTGSDLQSYVASKVDHGSGSSRRRQNRTRPQTPDSPADE
ncbi:MAG: hypothetical protein ABJF23_27015 [Bryobacteraceae bacterium]